jgi:polyhydroxyalkanoate synthase
MGRRSGQVATDEPGRPDGSFSRAAGERAVDAVLGANPFVRIDPTETLAATGKLAVRALSRPRFLLTKAQALAAKTRAIVAGGGDPIAPPDRQFADPSWQESAVYRRWLHAYRVLERELKGLPDQLPLGTKDAAKARFLLSAVADALAPTNLLMGNPTALRRARDTRGLSVVAGARNFVR